MKEFAAYVEKVDWLFVFLFYFAHVVLLLMSIFTLVWF
jgi:hypothetical protein